MMDKTKIPTTICNGIPTTKIFNCGMVRANTPKPTFVSRIAKVTGIAIFMPVRKIPEVKSVMRFANPGFACIPSKGTA